jgi:hypothetical protein
MRKIAAVIAALLPLAAYPAAATYTNPSGTTAVISCAQAGVTCDAPTLATQGLKLDRIQGFNVTACADAAQTLSGAGTLLAYIYDETFGVWSRIPDLDLTVGTATVRCLSFAATWVAAPRGRVAYVPSTVTASSNLVVVYIIGETK